MLGNAGGARIQEEVGLRKALTSFGRAGDVTRADIVEVAESLNNTCDEIKKGWWVVNYCMGTCPHKWAQVVYSQWSMKRMAKSLVSQQLGGSFGLPALKDVDAFSYKTVVSTMVNSVWTFMQAVDNSIVQRALLSVWMLPGAAFRALFGLKPFGMCFFKSSWAEMQKLTTYRMKSTGWWDAVLAGCGEDSNSVSDAFEDTSGTEKLLDGMVYSISKQNDLTGDSDEAENEVAWATIPTYSQCVLKLSRNGKWVNRFLHIEKGMISWTPTTDCNSSRVNSGLAWLGALPTKRFAMQFLTAPKGEEPVALSDSHNCISLQNPYRKFEFCATQEGETMARANEVIDEQMTVIKHEREILSIAAKLERLIATAMPDDPEAAEIGKDMDMTGDSSTDELAEKVGGATFAGGGSEEDRDAEKILAQIRHSSSLLQNGGNATHGHALLAEAFDQALAHEGLSNIMEGQTKVSYAGSAAGGGGTLTVTEMILIIVLCGSMLCTVLAYGYFSSTVETSSKVEALPRLLSNTNSTQPKLSPKKP
jgi:hypothetical protein